METNVSIVKRRATTSVSIGSRLREERERLGLNQEAFAQITPSGTRQSQSNYEKGARSPDAEYLAAISGAGADVLYIITGERRGTPLGSFRPDLLQQVVEGAEEALLAKRLRVAPDKKGGLIVVLYDHFSKTGTPVEKATIERFLRLVK